MIADLGLALSVVSAGLWSGLLLTLTTMLHPICAADSPGDFARDLRRFLPIARRSPTNYVLVLLLLFAPVLALIGLRAQVSSAPFVLTALGLAATIAGPLLGSRLLAEPNYDVILGWDPQAVPDDWLVARARYFRFNWVRGWLTWIAFALFAAATYLHLT